MHQILWPVCALALLTAGCDNNRSVRITTTSTTDDKGVLKVVETLQCPQNQGVLTRKGSASANGRTCIYSGPRGAEVALHLVALDGRSSQAALKPFEDSLSASLPEALAQADASKARADADAARADADAARADAEAARADAIAASEAGDNAQVRAPGVAVDAQGDKASVRLPGMRIDADGDRANIKIGGITIRADDRNSNVDITSDRGDVTVNADDGGTRVLTNASGQAVRATFLMTAADPAADGWRMVAYEARGPAGGPIVVATVRTKERNENRVMDAAKALVKLNVGD